MAAITEDEIHLLKLLRQRIRDLDLNEQQTLDHNLVRWIRARDNNLSAAEKMLREHVKWRKDNDIENILSWQRPSDGYVNRYPYHIGTTRDNGIFLIFVPGRVDVQAIVAREENKQVFLKHINSIWEEVALKLEGRKNSAGLPVTQVTWIVDFKGFTLASNMSFGALGLMKDIVVQFEANQPERLQTGLILNPSKIISNLLTIMKTVFSSKTFDKLVVVDPDPAKCKTFLLSAIPEEELPMLYGGKNAYSTLNQFL